MKFLQALLLALVSSVSAQDTCGADGTITIAGSTTVLPIAQSWAEGYEAKCPGVTVVVEGGGSSVGARRVCNRTDAGTAVDIGNMSRNWRIGSEVNVTDAATGQYICNQGTRTREVVQVDVAVDGLTVVLINGGLVAQCLRKLPGKGLSIDQLRWIYSNYTAAQLTAAGWNGAAALNNSDASDATHRWSEISNLCPSAEIKLASPGLLSGTYDFFKEVVLPNATEGIATNRPGAPLVTSEDDEELVQFVATSSEETYGDALTYFGYAYYAAEGAIFYGTPILPIGASPPNHVAPTVANVLAGTYTPLSRRIYMNFFKGALPTTAAFLSYGFNAEGIARIEATGYVPPPEDELPGLLARVGRDPPVPVPVPAPTLPPVVPTVTVPPTATDCGLLGLSIFCPLTGCGIFGRLLGLCN